MAGRHTDALLTEPTVERVLNLADGRRLGLAEFGSRSSLPIIYCHGFFGSRLEPASAGPLRVNAIAFDRPCYGTTDPQPIDSLAAWGRDVRAALDGLDVEECIVLGVSAGAPYALAAADALGHRVRQVILLAGVAGHELLRTSRTNRIVLALLQSRSAAIDLFEHLLRVMLIRGIDSTLVRRAIVRERRALERHGFVLDVLQARLLQSMRAGIRHSLDGPLADMRLLGRPWDFDVAHVKSEVLILHGGSDPLVPLGHARWYATHLPLARLEIMPGEMHLSLCFSSAELIQDIAVNRGFGASRY